MAKYAAVKTGSGTSTTLDFITLVSTATGAGSVLRVYEISLSGESASTTVFRAQVTRAATAGITINNTQTPIKLDAASANGSFSIAGTAAAVSNWGTQPDLTGTNPVLVPAFNSFGGVYRWVAPPDSEIIVGDQGAVSNLSFRSGSGTPTISGHVLVEER
jgi:hypothetical protein